MSYFRLLLIPLYLYFYFAADDEGGYGCAAAVIAVSGLTDMLDGKIARKYNLVTNFGKFMDPLADKLLVAAALICFVEVDRIPAWIVLIIISREFIISGFRLVAAEGGKVQALVYHSHVVPAMEALRAPVDQLEMIVDKELWPMPSYGDLIFEV